MKDRKRLFLVNESVLPPVFAKVVEAKRLLASGEAKHVSQAVDIVGISRSAFYKYKENVSLPNENQTEHLYTLYAALKDQPGVLSNYIMALTNSGGNIATINQSIPIDGVAPVSVSLRTRLDLSQIMVLLEKLRTLEGVVSVRKL